jgi:hypothetical protein
LIARPAQATQLNMKSKPKSIDQYLDSVTPELRERLAAK